MSALLRVLPCPFCGSTDLRVLEPTCTPKSSYNPLDRAYPIVRCSGCNAEAAGENWDTLGMSAIRAWNRRAVTPENNSKPVAWMYERPDSDVHFDTDQSAAESYDPANGWTETPLYDAAGLLSQREADAAEIERLEGERDRWNRSSGYWRGNALRNTDARLAAEAERDRMAEALKSIAEGNLGDQPWQAGYDRIREVARAALNPESPTLQSARASGEEAERDA